MRRDLSWTSILTRIAQQGAITYNELKRMKVDEFFLLYRDYESQMERNDKLIHHAKSRT